MAADTFIDCQNVEVIMDGEMQKQYAPDNNIYEGYHSVTGNGKIRVDVEYHGV